MTVANSEQTVMQGVPVTVIGGFLGTGKTTLLNRVLNESHGVRYAVLVNDFGKVNIDTQLMGSHAGETISFANGCVCCSLGDNLIDTIDRLLASDKPPEQILIEASGVANPRNIADVASLHPQLQRDLIVVTADASTVMARATDSRLADTVTMQLECADLIVLNKCDLVTQPHLEQTLHHLTQKSPAAVVTSVRADIPLQLLSATESQALSCSEASASSRQHDHDKALNQFCSITINLPKPIALTRLTALLREQGGDLLRAKGFIKNSENSDALTLVQLSGSKIDTRIIEPSEHNERACHVVLIGLGSLPMPDAFVHALM